MGNICVAKKFGNITADAVVVGGGIVGTSTAFWLSKAGMKVVLLEMRDALSSLTTAASVECFRTQFTEKSMADLALESVGMFENFGEVTGIPDIDIGITQRGYLFVTDSADMIPDLEKAVARYHELGVKDAEFLSGQDLHGRFPFLSPESLAATYNQKDGWLSTHEATYGFAKGSANADFYTKTKVTDIVVDAQGVSLVETDMGNIHTRLVVNCAGPFAGNIGRMAGLEMPLRTVRRQKCYIKVDPALLPEKAPFMVDLLNHSYWRPEAGGLLCAWVDPDEPDSEPREDLPTDWDFAAESIHRVSRLNPFFETVADKIVASDIDVSAGMYVYTPDDKPVIGPSGEVEGLHLNCGYWCGVMMSPGAGKRVADIATGKMDNSDNPLRYSRFAEGVVEKGATFLK
ncbi:putative FAD dependent oxidoreductase [Desulfamplus magnetovallimortis]|uniref:Putative FAD dependent oxidoreductase n=1 Tax=Desulfamplus magnetovallimortis TaxID=1246637 RepID=A0A1W1H750_9BACT|nr:FAD-dependent oxidoreductase [Desulfamplus magnetovallimortis]SLM28279.1 putative FAD dependent oxidoreductase [Desulfamplus magnetovallimortis]